MSCKRHADTRWLFAKPFDLVMALQRSGPNLACSCFLALGRMHVSARLLPARCAGCCSCFQGRRVGQPWRVARGGISKKKRRVCSPLPFTVYCEHRSYLGSLNTETQTSVKLWISRQAFAACRFFVWVHACCVATNAYGRASCTSLRVSGPTLLILGIGPG